MNQSDFQDSRNDAAVSSEETSFADILSEFEKAQHADEGAGENLEGHVLQITPDYVVVDIGRKMEGVLPLASVRSKTGEIEVKPGDKALVNITGRVEGYYLLSPLEIKRPKDWSGLQKALDEKQIVAGTVIEAIRGGFAVDIGTRAFMPGSRSGLRDQSEAQALVGQEIRCRIIKIDPEREDVVVDRRAVLEEEEGQAKRRVFESLQEGAAVRGTVRNLTDYGAFVDLGGVDGLLHVSDISYGRVGKPSDVLSEGQQIDVKVLKIDPKNRRISLGMKQLIPDPWSQITDKYQIEQRITGKVVRVTDFGAFVELEPGIEGLIHLSEMSWSKKVRRPTDTVKPGEVVDVMVLSVKPEEKRIGLGLKQVLGDPWMDVDKRFPVGSVVEGPVTSIAKFGAFVELGDGIEGMIHIGDITAERRLNTPQEVLKLGEKVRAQVLEIDRERRRLRLGMRQLEPTVIDQFIAEHNQGDTVTGRVTETQRENLKVELGEGVFAFCKLPREERPKEEEEKKPASADLSSLTAMLTAKWKGGGETGGLSSESSQARPGQVRTFRIISLDPEHKRIDLELAG